MNSRYANDLELHAVCEELIEVTTERNGAFLEADRLRQQLNALKKSCRSFVIENGRLMGELGRTETLLREAKDEREAMRQIALTWEAKVLDLQDELNNRRMKPVRFVKGENHMSFAAEPRAAACKD